MNKELIEKYRNINVECGAWYDFVYEGFIEKMKTVGIWVAQDTRYYKAPRIYFSGFCCQGDGAYFEGCVDDWDVFLKAHFKEHDPTRRWLDAVSNAQGETPEASWVQSGHYYHSHSLSFDIVAPDLDDSPYHIGDDEDGEPMYDLQGSVLRVLEQQFSFNDFEAEVKDIVRGYCDDLYRELEQEYEYLTSDEAVWDTIVCNELDKEVEETA